MIREIYFLARPESLSKDLFAFIDMCVQISYNSSPVITVFSPQNTSLLYEFFQQTHWYFVYSKKQVKKRERNNCRLMFHYLHFEKGLTCLKFHCIPLHNVSIVSTFLRKFFFALKNIDFVKSNQIIVNFITYLVHDSRIGVCAPSAPICAHQRVELKVARLLIKRMSV